MDMDNDTMDNGGHGWVRAGEEEDESAIYNL